MLNFGTNAVSHYLLECIGVNATFNAGTIKWGGKYIVVVRGEGNNYAY